MHEFAQDLLPDNTVDNQTNPESFLYPNSIVKKELREQLYLLILEVFTNIRKHANCNSASIQFTCDEEGLSLKIKDDGDGFNINEVKQNGHGLGNLAARAKKINARYNIDSQVGTGTTIWIQVPNFPNP